MLGGAFACMIMSLVFVFGWAGGVWRGYSETTVIAGFEAVWTAGHALSAWVLSTRAVIYCIACQLVILKGSLYD